MFASAIKELNVNIEALTQAYNKDVQEYNSAINDIESLEAEVARLKATNAESDLVLKNQHEALQVLDKSNRSLEAAYNAAKKDMTLLQSQITMLNRELKAEKHKNEVAKKELKPLREQVKRLKAANVAKDKSAKKSNAIKLDKDGCIANPDLGWLYTCFINKQSDYEEILQVYPHRLTLRHEDNSVSEQYTLLYTDKRGAYITAALEDENLVWSEQLVFDDATPERTRTLASKFTMKPSKEAESFAKTWLYTVNIIQGGRIKPTDLNRTVV